MKIVARSLAFVLAIPLLSGANHARARDPVGCYLATPPLHTPTAVEASLDTARAIIAIEANGVLSRPQLPRTARVQGEWNLRGDSLHASFTDGFTGWRYRLGATAEGWQGFAEYLSDEIIPGDVARSLRRPAVWIRRACP